MPKLIIMRPNEWVNQTKHISIYVDDVKAGVVGINQTVEIDVTPGKHKVALRTKWAGGSKTIAVDLSDNKNKTFMISSNQYVILITPLFVIIASILHHGAASIFDLQPTFLSNIIGVGLIYILLFMPFYSRYYMTLKEVKLDESKKRTKDEQARLLRKIIALDEKEEVYEV